MIAELVSYYKILAQSGFDVASVITSELLNLKSQSYPESWDLPTKMAVTMLRSFINGNQATIKRIQNTTKYAWLPSSSGTRIEHVSFEYSVDRVMDLERQGRIFKNPRLPDIFNERKAVKHVRLTAEWVETAKSEKVVLYIHGGAFFCSSAATHRMLTSRIAAETGASLLAIDYRLAPEDPFPAALHDCLAAYLYLVDPNNPIFPTTTKRTPIDPKNIIIMGDSSGGNLVVSLLLYLKDYLKASSTTLQFQLPLAACLMSPWLDLTCSSESWKQNSEKDYLPDASKCTFFDDIFVSDKGNPVQWYTMGQASFMHDLEVGVSWSDLKLNDLLSELDIAKIVCHPLVSPLFGDLTGLPPILVHFGDAELLRDDIKCFVDKLKSANPEREHYSLVEYESMPHVFQMFLWLKESQSSIVSISAWANSLWLKKQKEITSVLLPPEHWLVYHPFM